MHCCDLYHSNAPLENCSYLFEHIYQSIPRLLPHWHGSYVSAIFVYSLLNQYVLAYLLLLHRHYNWLFSKSFAVTIRVRCKASEIYYTTLSPISAATECRFTVAIRSLPRKGVKTTWSRTYATVAPWTYHYMPMKNPITYHWRKGNPWFWLATIFGQWTRILQRWEERKKQLKCEG